MIVADILNTLLSYGNFATARSNWQVRGMFDEHGMPVQQSKPGHAVQVIGWKSLPSAGEKIIQVPDEVVQANIANFVFVIWK